MKAKKQHYVPRFYLEGFTNSLEEERGRSVLWVYEKGREPRRSAPKNEAFEKYFYEYPKGEERTAY